MALDQFIGVLCCIPGPSLISGGSYPLFSCQDMACLNQDCGGVGILTNRNFATFLDVELLRNDF